MNKVHTPRVLMLVENNSFPKDSRVRKEAQTLLGAGYKVFVVSPAERSQSWRESVNGIEVYRYPAVPGGQGVAGYLWEYSYAMVAIAALMFWIFVRHGIDVIHVANPPDTLAFIAVPYKLFGTRLVFDHHDLAPEMYFARFPNKRTGWVHKALLQCEKGSCRLADHVVVTNASYSEIDIQRNGVHPENISIVRNGPEEMTFRHAEANVDLRSRGGTVIAYAGIIGVQDGVDYLLHALRHLIDDFHKTDFVCCIIGDGDELPALKRKAKELGIADYVLFPGWISHPDVYASYLQSADICVDSSPLNSYNDCCTTIKLMEYMAAEKPIVAFDLREHRLTAGDAALYAFPNDVQEFASLIGELMDDEPRRRAMGRFGRMKVEQELNWAYSARDLLLAYERLLAARAPKRPQLTVESLPSELPFAPGDVERSSTTATS